MTHRRTTPNDSEKERPRRGMKVRVRVRPSSRTAAEIHASPDVPPALRRHLARLLKHENEILGWLQGDPNRAARFLADPVGALRASAIDLEPELLSALDQGVARGRPHAVVPSDVRIDRLEVEVADDPSGNGYATSGDSEPSR